MSPEYELRLGGLSWLRVLVVVVVVVVVVAAAAVPSSR